MGRQKSMSETCVDSRIYKGDSRRKEESHVAGFFSSFSLSLSLSSSSTAVCEISFGPTFSCGSLAIWLVRSITFYLFVQKKEEKKKKERKRKKEKNCTLAPALWRMWKTLQLWLPISFVIGWISLQIVMCVGFFPRTCRRDLCLNKIIKLN